MRTDLRLLRYFVATAEDLHFRRAADRLGIAQPALSRAIRALEAELGVALFNRSNRQVQLTPAGHVFLDRGREILNLMERAVEDAKIAHEGRYTDIAIDGSQPTLLTDYHDRQPQITLKPQHGVTLTQMLRLAQGKLDVGFVTGPVNKDGYDQLQVQSEAFVCVCSENHPFAKRSAIQLAELAAEDFVHGGSTDWQHFYD